MICHFKNIEKPTHMLKCPDAAADISSDWGRVAGMWGDMWRDVHISFLSFQMATVDGSSLLGPNDPGAGMRKQI